MSSTVLGVFGDRENAENAINELRGSGYDPKNISIVMKDESEGTVINNNTGASVATGAASGATTGGVIGALAGLLVGIGAIAVPGVGALLIGGPLAVALGLTGAAASTVTGAVTGALAGGLLGALMGMGVPEEDARIYEERVKGGGILIAVPARDGEGTEARDILESNGADQIRTVTNKT
jgi:hypothetical protein